MVVPDKHPAGQYGSRQEPAHFETQPKETPFGGWIETKINQSQLSAIGEATWRPANSVGVKGGK